MSAVLTIDGLTIRAAATGAEVVKAVSLSIAPGEVVALIGESGSGKSTVCLSALGHVRPGLEVVHGTVRLGDTELLSAAPETLRVLRGRRVAYVAQSASASFNPSLTVGAQVTEPARVHGVQSAEEAGRRARELYAALGLPDIEHIGERYPHQVSGGQLQRLMAAMAFSCGPELLVLDEPTTALDVTTQISVLMTFKEAIRSRGAAALYVTHDLAVVAQLADRILVMKDGCVLEQGPTRRIVESATHPYTRALIEAHRHWVPGHVAAKASASASTQSAPLLSVTGLSAGYGDSKNGKPPALAVDSADLTLEPASVLGIVGESGSGKSTLARSIAGLLPPCAGSISLAGRALGAAVADRSKDDLRRIQIVFQSPDVSLNPAQSIGDILGRPLAFYFGTRGAEQGREVARLLDMVQLPDSFATRRPHELSGGQKQRVNLARALAARPDVILCDEITSALDTIVTRSIIELLQDLKTAHKLAFAFISHDISTVASFSDQIVVMHRGRIVERGPTDRVLNAPREAYTQVLVSSVPQLRIGWLEDAVARRQRAIESQQLALAD